MSIFNIHEDLSLKDGESLSIARDRAERIACFFDDCPKDAPVSVVNPWYKKVLAGEVDESTAAAQVWREVESRGREIAIRSTTPFFNIAEQWATRTGFTPEELCHGVARSAYIAVLTSGFVVPKLSSCFDAGKAYNTTYDTRKAESIAAKLVRSSSELFD